MNLLPANMSRKLPVGRQALTDLQQRVIDDLITNSRLTAKELAEKHDCTTVAVYRMLQKQHVKDYIIANVNARLLMSSGEAMLVQQSLLQSKSDYIKHEAAKDILNRNDIGNSNQVLGQTVQVKIDLS